MTTRRQNALALLRAPIYLAAGVVAAAYMVATVPLLVLAIAVTLVPAELLWAVSPFVGLVSPRVGHALASRMEPAMDRFDALMDAVWDKPLGLLLR